MDSIQLSTRRAFTELSGLEQEVQSEKRRHKTELEEHRFFRTINGGSCHKVSFFCRDKHVFLPREKYACCYKNDTCGSSVMRM